MYTSGYLYWCDEDHLNQKILHKLIIVIERPKICHFFLKGDPFLKTYINHHLQRICKDNQIESIVKSDFPDLLKGVDCSLDRLYAMAERNKIPYLKGDPHYNDDAATNLERNETLITNYKATELLNLSEDGLEKVYIQQYIDRFYRIDGQWNLMKRSGIPMVNSKYLPWEPLSGDINNLMPIARRPYVETPSETNSNFENAMASLTRRGFTLGTKDPVIMSKERQWWDKENPEFHTGPRN